MASVHYRNKKTGTVVTYSAAVGKLERSEVWERVKSREVKKPDPKPVKQDG